MDEQLAQYGRIALDRVEPTAAGTAVAGAYSAFRAVRRRYSHSIRAFPSPMP
jgi:hypothetical protein